MQDSKQSSESVLLRDELGTINDCLVFAKPETSEHLLLLVKSGPELGQAVQELQKAFEEVSAGAHYEGAGDENALLTDEEKERVQNLIAATYPLTYLGGLLEQVAHRGKDVKRWANYAVTDFQLAEDYNRGHAKNMDFLAPHAVMADGTVVEHSIRQAQVTALSAMLDAIYSSDEEEGPELFLTPEEVDILTLVAFVHDLGEYVVGDITYDIKQELGEDHELQEAIGALGRLDDTLKEIDNVPEWMQKLVKIAYLRVATKLSPESLANLEKDLELHVSVNEVPVEYNIYRKFFENYERWDLLRQKFKLYERYGYLVTAVQSLREVKLIEGSTSQRGRPTAQGEDVAFKTEYSGDSSESSLPVLLTEEEKKWASWMDRKELELLLAISDATQQRHLADRHENFWKAYNYGLEQLKGGKWSYERFSEWQGIINRAATPVKGAKLVKNGGNPYIPSLNFRRVILASNVLRNQTKHLLKEAKGGTPSTIHFGDRLVIEGKNILGKLRR